MRVILSIEIDQLNLFFPQIFFEVEKKLSFQGRMHVYPQLVLSEQFFAVLIHFWLVYESVSDKFALWRQE